MRDEGRKRRLRTKKKTIICGWMNKKRIRLRGKQKKVERKKKSVKDESRRRVEE